MLRDDERDARMRDVHALFVARRAAWEESKRKYVTLYPVKYGTGTLTLDASVGVTLHITAPFTGGSTAKIGSNA